MLPCAELIYAEHGNGLRAILAPGSRLTAGFLACSLLQLQATAGGGMGAAAMSNLTLADLVMSMCASNPVAERRAAARELAQRAWDPDLDSSSIRAQERSIPALVALLSDSATAKDAAAAIAALSDHNAGNAGKFAAYYITMPKLVTLLRGEPAAAGAGVDALSCLAKAHEPSLRELREDVRTKAVSGLLAVLRSKDEDIQRKDATSGAALRLLARIAAAESQVCRHLVKEKDLYASIVALLEHSSRSACDACEVVALLVEAGAAAGQDMVAAQGQILPLLQRTLQDFHAGVLAAKAFACLAKNGNIQQLQALQGFGTSLVEMMKDSRAETAESGFEILTRVARHQPTAATELLYHEDVSAAFLLQLEKGLPQAAGAVARLARNSSERQSRFINSMRGVVPALVNMLRQDHDRCYPAIKAIYELAHA